MAIFKSSGAHGNWVKELCNYVAKRLFLHISDVILVSKEAMRGQTRICISLSEF